MALHRAHVLRVTSANCLHLRISLPFRVMLEKLFLFGAIDLRDMPRELKDGVSRSLIMAVGGKKVVIDVNDDTFDKYLEGTVYAPIGGTPGEHSCVVSDLAEDIPYALNVGSFMAMVLDHGGDPEFARKELEGIRNGHTVRQFA